MYADFWNSAPGDTIFFRLTSDGGSQLVNCFIAISSFVLAKNIN